jgi:hypothetical protein
MIALVLALDARGAGGRYIKLMGPLLQPEAHENQTAMDLVELTDEFLRGPGQGGCR